MIIKQYPYRSGLYLGTLESLKYENEIFKMFDCDRDKMDKFSAHIQKRLASLQQRIDEHESICNKYPDHQL